MKKTVFLVFVISMILYSSVSAQSSTPVNLSQGCNPTAQTLPVSLLEITSVHRSLEYLDLDLGFSFLFPDTSEVVTRFAQKKPYDEPERIIKRLSILSQGINIDLDYWQANGRGFQDWKKDQIAVYSLEPASQFSIQLIDRSVVDAFYFKSSVTNALLLSVDHSDEFVQFWFNLTSNPNDLKIFFDLVESFTFNDGYNIGKNILNSPKIDELSVAGKLDYRITTGSDLCCWIRDTGNPFPCCGNQEGNCTWYVYYMAGYVPFRGDAWQWWSQVPSFPSYSRGSIPQVDIPNIVWWDRAYSGDYGHVA
jgi:hypothetical protein